ncbi:MAG TPA: hypothetical protein VJW94_17730 [Candidatus Acidoferrum sp.]|nr:hypothetical protein [Candidatus Acidoferrum sp.]
MTGPTKGVQYPASAVDLQAWFETTRAWESDGNPSLLPRVYERKSAYANSEHQRDRELEYL